MSYAFSEDARAVIRAAGEEAQRLKHEYIGTEHILLGMMKTPSCIAMRIIATSGCDTVRIVYELEHILRSGPGPATPAKTLTPRAKVAVEFAIIELPGRRLSDVNSGHLLVGLLLEPEGVAHHVLSHVGLDCQNARAELLKILDGD